MCLASIQLKLSKNKDGDWTGIGYKYIEKHQLDSLKRLNYYAINRGWSRKWCEAKNILLMTDDNSNTYSSGFHIFLEKEHAKKYAYYFDGKIMKVEFSNVIGFGTNALFGIYKTTLVPCVIANRMRVLELTND